MELFSSVATAKGLAPFVANFTSEEESGPRTKLCDRHSHGSLAKNGLDLGMQRFPLRRLAAHRTKASNTEQLARDLAGLALGQCSLRQAALSLRLGASENRGPGTLTLCNNADLLGLHRLHGFHSLHGLHGLHGL